jgi:hypothetical protein
MNSSVVEESSETFGYFRRSQVRHLSNLPGPKAALGQGLAGRYGRQGAYGWLAAVYGPPAPVLGYRPKAARRPGNGPSMRWPGAPATKAPKPIRLTGEPFLPLY